MSLSSCWSGLILTFPASSFKPLLVQVSWKLLVPVLSGRLSCQFLPVLLPTPLGSDARPLSSIVFTHTVYILAFCSDVTHSNTPAATERH